MDKNVVYQRINELCNAFEEKQIEIFHWLHQHPELAFQEFQSGQYIVDHLNEMNGIEVIYPIAKTGIKAVSTVKIQDLRFHYGQTLMHCQ